MNSLKNRKLLVDIGTWFKRILTKKRSTITMSKKEVKNNELEKYVKEFLKKSTEIITPYVSERNIVDGAKFSKHKEGIRSEIENTQEYKKMREIISKDKIITHHFDKVVGIRTDLARIELQQITNGISNAIIDSIMDENPDDKTIDEIYENFESFFYNDKIELVEITPISHLRLAKLPISLEGLTIRWIKPSEKKHFEEERYGLRALEYHFTNHVIEYRYSLTKIIKEDSEKIDQTKKNNEVEPKQEIGKVISALRIFNEGGFDYNISIRKLAGSVQFMGIVTSLLQKPSIFQGEYFLDSEKVDKFLTFWKKYHNSNYLNYSPNRISVKRFSNSYEKTDAEDILIDMLIAFESLFFKSGETGEQNHKIGTRIAKLLEEKFEERKALFKHMKEIYHIRSAIVHGDSPSFSKTDFENIYEMNKKVKYLLRESIKIFIEKQIDSQEKHGELITKLDLE